jgi:hypothetical protein
MQGVRISCLVVTATESSTPIRRLIQERRFHPTLRIRCKNKRTGEWTIRLSAKTHGQATCTECCANVSVFKYRNNHRHTRRLCPSSGGLDVWSDLRVGVCGSRRVVGPHGLRGPCLDCTQAGSCSGARRVAGEVIYPEAAHDDVGDRFGFEFALPFGFVDGIGVVIVFMK